MLSAPSSVPYAPLRLPLRRSPFRLAAYRRPRSGGCVAAGRRRLSPVLTPALSPFRALYAGGFVDAASPGTSRRPWPSPVLARLGSPLLPLRGLPYRRGRLRFMLRTGELLDPLTGPLSRRFAGRLSPGGGRQLPGGLVPTRTGLSPAGQCELAQVHPYLRSPPPFLGASLSGHA